MTRKKTFTAVGAVALLLAGIAIGVGIGGRNAAHRPHESSAEQASDSRGPELWTCSMHPQIKLPKPGKCPICFMDLIPVRQQPAGGFDDAPNRIALSPQARKLAAIATVPAVRRGLTSRIRLSGKVAVDETRQSILSARFHGRIDRRYVNSTGITVRKGDHLAEIYGPDLIGAQQELLSASRALSSPSADTGFANSRRLTLDAAKEKLRLLGFSDPDINAVLSRQAPGEEQSHTRQPAAAAHAAPPPRSQSFVKQLDPAYSAYFDAADFLSRDDLTGVKKAFDALYSARGKIGMSGSSDAMWKSILAGLDAALVNRSHAASLADARAIFEKTSAQIIRMAKTYGNSGGDARERCHARAGI